MNETTIDVEYTVEGRRIKDGSWTSLGATDAERGLPFAQQYREYWRQHVDKRYFDAVRLSLTTKSVTTTRTVIDAETPLHVVAEVKD